jgi:zinc-ribbon domain
MSCLNCGQEINDDARFCPRCGAPALDSPTRELPMRAATTRVLGSPYVRALRRYWWLLLIGVGVATLAAVAAVYRIDFGSVPPTLEKRAQVTYTASARLLVTSAEAPYFRTTVPRTTEGPASDDSESNATTFRSAPDLGTLISTANLYPVLIESDEVQRIRQEKAGVLPGSVTARAIYAVSSANRFELSQVPVVEVYANAGTYSGAVKLARATVEAFKTYIDRNQDAAGLDGDERILLQDLQRPEDAIATGGSSLSLPLMLFVVVSAAFAALAIVLDRLFPAGVFASRRLRSRPPSARDGRPLEPSSEPEVEARRMKAQV